MFSTRKYFRPLTKLIGKPFINIRNYQVTVVGSSSEIGQTLCMLLRTEAHITNLVVHGDPATHMQNTISGVTLDLSHIPATLRVISYRNENSLSSALSSAHIVLVVGDAPSPCSQESSKANTALIKTMCNELIKLETTPFIGIAIEPINSTIPMTAQLLRGYRDFNLKKLFGITTLDALRAQTIYADDNNFNPLECSVPVICGHSATTMVPLMSQAQPKTALNEIKIQNYIDQVRSADISVLAAKKQCGPTLSVAYGIAKFTQSLLKALEGNISTVNAFVENDDYETSYFSGPVYIDENGIRKTRRYDTLTRIEKTYLGKSIDILKQDIKDGRKMLEVA